MRDARTYVDFYQQAHDRIALKAGQELNNSGKYTADDFTDEQLLQIIAADMEKAENKSGK